MHDVKQARPATCCTCCQNAMQSLCFTPRWMWLCLCACIHTIIQTVLQPAGEPLRSQRGGAGRPLLPPERGLRRQPCHMAPPRWRPGRCSCPVRCWRSLPGRPLPFVAGPLESSSNLEHSSLARKCFTCVDHDRRSKRYWYHRQRCVCLMWLIGEHMCMSSHEPGCLKVITQRLDTNWEAIRGSMQHRHRLAMLTHPVD